MSTKQMTVSKARARLARVIAASDDCNRDNGPSFHTGAHAHTFHDLVMAAVNVATRHNIQACVAWFAKTAFPSPKICAAVGRYLADLSRSFGSLPLPDKTVAVSGSALGPIRNRMPTCERKRLHVLMIMNDLLHFTFRTDRKLHELFIIHVGIAVLNIVSAAASCDRRTNVAHHERLRSIIQLWGDLKYFHLLSKDFTACLQMVREMQGSKAGPEIIDIISRCKSMQAATAAQVEANATTKQQAVGAKAGTAIVAAPAETAIQKQEPHERLLPIVHGDPYARWCDTPASALAVHVRYDDHRERLGVETKTFRAIQFDKQPPMKADKLRKVQSAVEKVLKHKAALYSGKIQDEPGIKYDLDEMGQRVIVKGFTTDKEGRKIRLVLPRLTYYGYTRTFARMLEKKRLKAQNQLRKTNSNSPPRGWKSPSRGYTPPQAFAPPPPPPSLQQQQQQHFQPWQQQGPPTGPRGQAAAPRAGANWGYRGGGRGVNRGRGRGRNFPY